MKYDVFISYAVEDSETAKYIANSLIEVGITVWIDKNNLRGGQVWAEEIVKVINSCSYFVVLLSNFSVSKQGYVRVEILEALETGRKQILGLTKKTQ